MLRVKHALQMLAYESSPFKCWPLLQSNPHKLLQNNLQGALLCIPVNKWQLEKMTERALALGPTGNSLCTG